MEGGSGESERRLQVAAVQEGVHSEAEEPVLSKEDPGQTIGKNDTDDRQNEQGTSDQTNGIKELNGDITDALEAETKETSAEGNETKNTDGKTSERSDSVSKKDKKKKKTRKSIVTLPGRYYGMRRKDRTCEDGKTGSMTDGKSPVEPTLSDAQFASAGCPSPAVQLEELTPCEPAVEPTAQTAAVQPAEQDRGELPAIPRLLPTVPELSQAGHEQPVEQEREEPPTRPRLLPTVPELSQELENIYDQVSDAPPVSLYRFKHRQTCDFCRRDDMTFQSWSRAWDQFLPETGSETIARALTERAHRAGYAWVPNGIDEGRIAEFMLLLPSYDIPLLSSAGERTRQRLLMTQLPVQDLSVSGCGHVPSADLPVLREFLAARNALALGVGYVRPVDAPVACTGCGGILAVDSLAVSGPGLDSGLWHPACFTCQQCGELLADLVFCRRHGQLFCLRHYDELFRPRCAACEELIFAGEYTHAMGLDWHTEHLACWQCGTPLTSGPVDSGHQFALRDQLPYCLSCYRTVSPHICLACEQPIPLSSRELGLRGRHWHAACFTCSSCRAPLEGQQFALLPDGQVRCGACHGAVTGPRCTGCGQPIPPGTRWMEYKSQHWHEHCFTCCVCRKPLGVRTFLPKDQRLFCSACFEETFASRCHKCHETITSLGVTYQGDTWHRGCFTCTHCDAGLAGQKFRSREARPYCPDCYNELFAKRCDRCRQPIARAPGTKYSVFEQRNWHNECFLCAECGSSLVGRGFMDVGTDIVCAECATKRLAAPDI